MNIDDIKRHGETLGLEAELNTQHAWVKNHVMDSKYQLALQAAKNCVALLEALVKINAKPTSQNQTPSQTR